MSDMKRYTLVQGDVTWVLTTDHAAAIELLRGELEEAQWAKTWAEDGSDVLRRRLEHAEQQLSQLRATSEAREAPRDYWKLRDLCSYSNLMLAYHSAESRFTDELLDLADDEDAFDYDRVGGDSYDGSIEIYGVANDVRLNEKQQKLIFDAGFIRCWLNHKDGMETYYSWGKEFRAGDGHRKLGHRAALARPDEPSKSVQRREALQREPPHCPSCSCGEHILGPDAGGEKP